MSTRRRTDEDFAREIESHIELEAERLIEEGMAPGAAAAEARRRFGSTTRVRERFYEARRILWLDRLRHDLRAAVRSMQRYPVAAAVAVLSLAAGIGAATDALTVRDAIFRRAPPLYEAPAQLSRVQVGRPERPIMPIGSAVPAPLYRLWSEALDSRMAAAAPSQGLRDVRTADRLESVSVRAVTPQLFALLGVPPVLGHVPDGREGGPAPAVLSYPLWQRLFDRRLDAVGQTIWIDDRPHTVAAVMPERFWFSEMNSPVWTVIDPSTLEADTGLEVIVRRPDDVTPEMLKLHLESGLAAYVRQLPADQRQLRVAVSGIEGTPLGRQVAPMLPYVLATSVLLTLLIACANVAVLMFAQWTAREHEFAIRASIGASRRRIVGSLLTEAVLVAACGGALGVCATFVLRGWIVRRAATDTALYDLSIAPAIMVQTAAIALLTGVAAGIAPALYETRRLHTNPLRAIGGSDRVRQRWRHTLVVLEITATVALLVVTAGMIDGYLRARRAQPGFLTRPLLTATLEDASGVPVVRILDGLHAQPGVDSAAATTAPPLQGGGGRRQTVSADAGGARAITLRPASVTSNFFSTLGVPLRSGRMFEAQDLPPARTVIVNETLAERVFSSTRAVGRRLWIAGSPHDIIGVVADYSNDPLQSGSYDPQVFLPLPQPSVRGRVHLLVRAAGDPAPLVEAVRRNIRRTSATTSVTSAYTVDTMLDFMSREILLGGAPLFPLIAIGTLLTTAGIYGVLAFAVARRSRELAVRVAVGASARDLVRLVGARSLRLVGFGTGLGCAVTFGLSRIVRATGGEGSVFDIQPGAFVVPVLIVMAIGVVATWIPSRRASRIDAAVLLRDS